MGVELDVFQLLTAWTWSEEFDLQVQFQELSEEFASFGFERVGSDEDLMLRCCAAVLQRDPSPASLVNMNGAAVRASFGVVQDAMRRAIDYVRANFNVRHVRFLPYESMLIPLAAFFSVRSNQPVTGAEHDALRRWFWRASLSHRYSGNPQRNIRRDIIEAVNLREGRPSTLADIPCTVDADFFTNHRFSVRTVASRTFILMLADLGPRSFLSGEAVQVDRVLAEPNRSEFHHCYPRAALLMLSYASSRVDILANVAIISRSENRTISDKSPSEYKALMPTNLTPVLDSALIPTSLFDDDYDAFLAARSQMLADRAQLLIA